VPQSVHGSVSSPRPVARSAAASEDIPTTSVRKSGLPNIIEVFVGDVHMCALGLL